ncbi:hypothetical protein RRG08_045526 [Elysia crispata]|uniref:Uncharacterized protein n=1 Tax=Elysia crispata TaxID=231223 RepID=A0AAE0YE03_9GAST|nr:hypothetical protein RRG08_045526 [Elysia crispata]
MEELAGAGRSVSEQGESPVSTRQGRGAELGWGGSIIVAHQINRQTWHCGAWSDLVTVSTQTQIAGLTWRHCVNFSSPASKYTGIKTRIFLCLEKYQESGPRRLQQELQQTWGKKLLNYTILRTWVAGGRPGLTSRYLHSLVGPLRSSPLVIWSKLTCKLQPELCLLWEFPVSPRYWYDKGKLP